MIRRFVPLLLVLTLPLAPAVAEDGTAGDSTDSVTDNTLEPVRVRVAPLAEIAIPVTRSVPATVVSLQTAVVASELAARVTEMPVVPGDVVATGVLLARLDCRDSRLALDSARSRLAALRAREELARQQLERLNKLLRNRNASEEQVDQRQAELDIVNAETATQDIAVNIAQQKVQRCDIRAPFPGLVTDTPGQPGNYLAPGSPVASLVNLDRVELKADLLESQVAELSSSSPVFEFGDRSWPLRIRSIFPVVDAATQTREVRFVFTSGKPPPGANGRLRWRLSGLTVPAAFVVERDGKGGVFSASTRGQTTVTFLPLVNARPGQPVTTDLPADTLIVTDGRFGLMPGQNILTE